MHPLPGGPSLLFLNSFCCHGFRALHLSSEDRLITKKHLKYSMKAPALVSIKESKEALKKIPSASVFFFWPVLNRLFTFLDTLISSSNVSVEVFAETMSSDHEGIPY